MRDLARRPELLSINTATVRQRWTLPQIIAGCAAQGIRAIAPWRDPVAMFRRLEARGVVRGGRFVSGFGGEQFALPEAADALRAGRNRTLAEMPPLTMAAADPMNLMGVVIPGDRVAAIAGNMVTLPPAAVPTETPVVEMPVARAFTWEAAAQEGGALA